MSRFLALDYGEKRIGVAITDPLCMFVKPFCTIDNRSQKYVFDTIKEIISSQEVERVIVGLPIAISGEDSAKTREVREFFKNLVATMSSSPSPAHQTPNTEYPSLLLWDERYSTTAANDFCKQKGLDWKQSRLIVDQIAAAIILQDYLDTINKQ